MDTNRVKMVLLRCCSVTLGCRGCYFLVLLYLLIVDKCQCHPNATGSSSRIFKREVLDGNLEEYLTRFGYIARSPDGANAYRTEESIRNAIRDMQEFAGIPATGKLDAKTVKLLRTPRCGLPDKELGLTSGRRKRYAIHGTKWPYTDLKWSLRSKSLAQDLDPYEVKYVIAKALEVWSKHSRLTFTEVDSDRADILIYFYRRDHGDNFPFDGKGVILAHAFFPTGTRSSVDVHFDADETWTTSTDSEQGTNLFNVAAHEIGHALGLSHSNVEGALMYPWYSELKGGFEYELPDDDKLAIGFLYGSKDLKQWGRIPQYYPAAPRPAPTTTTTTSTTTTFKPFTTPPRKNYNSHYPYDPRYPDGRNPYKPNRNPYKPMNPNKKSTDHHHKHTPSGPYQPSVPTTTITTTVKTTKHHHHQPTTRHNRHQPSFSPPKEYHPTTATGHGNRKSPPKTCDTSYDALAVIRRELFIFKDEYFWRIGDDGRVGPEFPAKIQRQFTGFPRNFTHVDAVFERSDGNIAFFIDDLLYVFDTDRLIPGYPRPLTDLGLSETIRKIDGAMVWGYNGKTYFFSGHQYWKFDDETNEVEKDYPREMTPMWKGVSPNIDAVFQWKDGKTYFFKDKGFWKFNDNLMRVEDYEQKLSAPVWMGCKLDLEENNDLNQKLPLASGYSGAAKSNRKSEFFTISIVIATVLLLR